MLGKTKEAGADRRHFGDIDSFEIDMQSPLFDDHYQVVRASVKVPWTIHSVLHTGMIRPIRSLIVTTRIEIKSCVAGRAREVEVQFHLELFHRIRGDVLVLHVNT